MKKILFVSIVSAIFVNLHAFSQELKEPKYISGKPEYAKLLLINSEELVLAFDESKGTDTGYDILYADVNFNKDLEDNKYVGTGSGVKYGMKNMSFNVEFNSNNISYLFNISKRERSMQNVVSLSSAPVVDDNSKGKDKKIENFISYVISAPESGTKWEYSNSFMFQPVQDINKIKSLKVFNKNIKFLVNSRLIGRAENKMLQIITSTVDENNQKALMPTVMKDKQRSMPSFTVQNEKGEIILNASLKPG